MRGLVNASIRIDGWDEKPTREFGDGARITHAVVPLVQGTEGLTSGHMESVLHYRPDGTSTYVTLLWLEGSLDRRSGSFVAIGEGTYDGTTAGGSMRIVGGDGDLAGITGTVGGESTHDDYPTMPLVIEYELP